MVSEPVAYDKGTRSGYLGTCPPDFVIKGERQIPVETEGLQ